MRINSDNRRFNGSQIREQIVLVQQLQSELDIRFDAAMGSRYTARDLAKVSDDILSEQYNNVLFFGPSPRTIERLVRHARNIVDSLDSLRSSEKFPQSVYRILSGYVSVAQGDKIGLFSYVTSDCRRMAAEVVSIALEKYKNNISVISKLDVFLDMIGEGEKQNCSYLARYHGSLFINRDDSWRTLVKGPNMSYGPILIPDRQAFVSLPKIVYKESAQDIRNNYIVGIMQYKPEVFLASNENNEEAIIDMSLYDGNNAVTIMLGVCRALSACNKRGEYYEQYKEVPDLSVSQKQKAAQVAIKLITRKIRENLSDNDLILLLNSTYCLNEVQINIGLEKAGDVKDPIGKAFHSLSKEDLLLLVKTLARETGKGYKIWNNFGPTFSTLLAHRRISMGSSSVSYFMDLREKVDLLRREVGIIGANINDAIKRIDSAIVESLGVSNFNDRKLYNAALTTALIAYPGFDPGVKDSLICHIKEAGTNGVLINNKKEEFKAVTSSENQEAIRAILRSEIYSEVGSISFTSPQSGRKKHSLEAYRNIVSSYRDYHGSELIKLHGAKLAEVVVNAPDKPKGLLLSGSVGTGKTFFGLVLSGQTGMNHILLSGNNFDKTKMTVRDPVKRVDISIDTFFDELLNAGPTVLILDEVETILPKTPNHVSNKIIEKIKYLRSKDGRILVIATTNSPGYEEGIKAKITPEGTSEDLNKALIDSMDSRVVDLFEPNFYFHLPQVGGEYALGHLKSYANQINGDLNKSEITRLCSHIPPKLIQEVLDELFSARGDVKPEEILSELRTLQLNSDYISAFAKQIRLSLEYKALDADVELQETLDFKAIASEFAGIHIGEVDLRLEGLNNFNYESITKKVLGT